MITKIEPTDYNKILITLLKTSCNLCPGCHRDYYGTSKCIVTRELMRNNNLSIQDINYLIHEYEYSEPFNCF